MSPSSENSPELELAKWLEEIGLGQYAALFIQERLTLELMPDVADEDLQGLGLPLGHRVAILRAARFLPAKKSSITAPNSLRREQESAPQRTEHRPLTVMFCDLTGSVPLSRFYGAEEFRNLLSEYREICATAVRRYDGFTARYVGDGILMYFGYPTAHEDDAERALRAALAIRAGIAELDKRMGARAGPGITVHLGIATGDVVVGDIVAGGTVEMAAATGDAPNLAARLQGMAPPGSILIDQATRDRAGELFEYSEVDALELKGFDHPVRILQLNGERVSTRFEARTRAPTRLLGRDEQLTALNRQWSVAKSGKFQIGLITGPAGIGKSRMIDGVPLPSKTRDEPVPQRRSSSSSSVQSSSSTRRSPR
jgi:class 3 adenylate cyclase